MASVNKVILIGNLGNDPELRKTPSGASVTSFSIATTERFSGRDGQKQENTEWHNIVVWNRMAETANQYLKKGSPVYIEGRIKTRSWDDKNGNKHYRTEIIATSMQFLGSGSASGQSRSYSQPQQSEPSNNFNIPDQSMIGNDQASEDDLPF